MVNTMWFIMIVLFAGGDTPTSSVALDNWVLIPWAVEEDCRKHTIHLNNLRDEHARKAYQFSCMGNKELLELKQRKTQ